MAFCLYLMNKTQKKARRGGERENSHRRVSPFSRGVIFLRKNGDYSCLGSLILGAQ